MSDKQSGIMDFSKKQYIFDPTTVQSFEDLKALVFMTAPKVVVISLADKENFEKSAIGKFFIEREKYQKKESEHNNAKSIEA